MKDGWLTLNEAKCHVKEGVQPAINFQMMLDSQYLTADQIDRIMKLSNGIFQMEYCAYDEDTGTTWAFHPEMFIASPPDTGPKLYTTGQGIAAVDQRSLTYHIGDGILVPDTEVDEWQAGLTGYGLKPANEIAQDMLAYIRSVHKLLKGRHNER